MGEIMYTILHQNMPKPLYLLKYGIDNTYVNEEYVEHLFDLHTKLPESAKHFQTVINKKTLLSLETCVSRLPNACPKQTAGVKF